MTHSQLINKRNDIISSAKLMEKDTDEYINAMAEVSDLDIKIGLLYEFLKVNRDYYLVSYAPGCYLGKEYDKVDEAIATIADLISDKDPYYSNRKYNIVHFVETAEIIEYPVAL